MGRMEENGYWYLTYMWLPGDSWDTEDGGCIDAYNWSVKDIPLEMMVRVQ